MPWVDKNDCSGCGICVEECPVDAILLVDEKAEINMEECIRCGVCHSVCSEEAVRHDSEKIPEMVSANVATTERYMEACASYLESPEEKRKCLKRMMKHFNNERVVAEKTLEKLQLMTAE